MWIPLMGIKMQKWELQSSVSEEITEERTKELSFITLWATSFTKDIFKMGDPDEMILRRNKNHSDNDRR